MIKSWENSPISEDVKQEKIDKLTKTWDMILRDIFEFDVDGDPNLRDTPNRIARMWFEILKGNYTERPKITTFNGEEMDACTLGIASPVLVGPIKIKSLCSHHFVPFVGECYISIIPDKCLIGLSKVARITSWLMRRPHIQEKLTQLIVDEINSEIPDAKGIAVYIKAQHLCMSYRGAEEERAHMVTYYGTGLYQDTQQMNQFLNICRSK